MRLIMKHNIRISLVKAKLILCNLMVIVVWNLIFRSVNFKVKKIVRWTVHKELYLYYPQNCQYKSYARIADGLLVQCRTTAMSTMWRCITTRLDNVYIQALDKQSRWTARPIYRNMSLTALQAGKGLRLHSGIRQWKSGGLLDHYTAIWHYITSVPSDTFTFRLKKGKQVDCSSIALQYDPALQAGKVIR